MDEDDLLTGLLVRGEISNYKCYPSGHHYFSLKDEQGSLRCVMFRGEAVRLRFRPANGMRVVAFGRVSVFPRDGQYQLYCSELMEDGRGALDEAFERLRRRLEAEGLFDPAVKQGLPRYPGKIALVTSPVGAAVRDMLRILGARWPLAEVLVVPVRVQGQEAAGEISAAIHRLNNRADIDLIIAGRGGGSKEDLWAFNEEVVARAIYLSNIPVISAVGHEPDVTIADYVADLRAATLQRGGAGHPRPERGAGAAGSAGPTAGQGAPRPFDSGAAGAGPAEKQPCADEHQGPHPGPPAGAGRSAAAHEPGAAKRDGPGPSGPERVSGPAASGGEGAYVRSAGPFGPSGGGAGRAEPAEGAGPGLCHRPDGRKRGVVHRAGAAGDRLEVLVSDGALRCEVKEKEERTWR